MSSTASMLTISGFQSGSTIVDGIRIHYWIGGEPNGVPVLLWHGFLGTSFVWREVMPRLADAGFRVLAPDMRGYGDSDKPEGTDGYDGRALAEEFRALVRELNFGKGRPLILAAHDMGAPPALLWAADHPEEIRGLLYMEVPVMLSSVLTKIISYTPQAMQKGSMWWWILPLAPGVPERFVVGREREFLTWFFESAVSRPETIPEATVDEYLRTFSGREGVLGAMGVYRAAFTTIAQTEPLQKNKVSIPIIALGGAKAQGGLSKNPKWNQARKRMACAFVHLRSRRLQNRPYAAYPGAHRPWVRDPQFRDSGHRRLPLILFGLAIALIGGTLGIGNAMGTFGALRSAKLQEDAKQSQLQHQMLTVEQRAAVQSAMAQQSKELASLQEATHNASAGYTEWRKA